MKKILFLCFSASLLLASLPAHARTEGFYIGGGYQQPIMLTWKKQSIVAPNPGDSISFWPGFGAFLIGGYDFEKPHWLGLALPVNWSIMRLNKSEWVHLINADAEAIFHLMPDTDSKFDPYIGVLVGFNFLTEGSVKDDSQSIGPGFGASFGFRYSLLEYATAGSPRVTNLSLMFEVPVKVILFLNDYDLSDSSTTTMVNLPVHIGLTYTF